MRFAGGTYEVEAEETALTSAQRTEGHAVAATDDRQRAQQRAEPYPRRAIGAASDGDYGQALAEFASEGADELLQLLPAEPRAMQTDTPVLQVATHPSQPADPGLLSRLFMRAARAPIVACALLLLAVLATSALLIAAAQKLGVL